MPHAVDSACAKKTLVETLGVSSRSRCLSCPLRAAISSATAPGSSPGRRVTLVGGLCHTRSVSIPGAVSAPTPMPSSMGTAAAVVVFG